MENIRIILADDHDLFRTGIKSLLEDHSEFEVVAEANDGKKIIELIKENDADIILMDNHLPSLTGIEATSQILAIKPNLKIIILSAYAETEDVRLMMKSGARGYMLKKASFQDLTHGILSVHNGNSYFCEEVSKKLFLQINSPELYEDQEEPKKLPISNRELEILQLITNENTNKEIAVSLNISRRTVDTHRRNLLQKLKVKNTAGLVRFFMEWKGKYGLPTSD